MIKLLALISEYHLKFIKLVEILVRKKLLTIEEAMEIERTGKK
jgi:hypothetical protein